MADEPVSSVLALMFFFFVGSLFARSVPERSRGWLYASVGLHVVSAVAQVLITWYVFGYGDMKTYIGTGQSVVLYPIPNKVSEIVQLLLHQSQILPDEVGSGTVQTMVGIGAALYMLLGDAPYAMCIVTAAMSFTGKALIFKAMSTHLPHVSQSRIAIATMLVPSMVFWTSGLLKESIAFLGLGLVMHGLSAMLRRRVVQSLPALAFGVLIIGLVKPYLLIPSATAGALWLFLHSSSKGFFASLARRPIILIAGAVIAVAGLVAIGRQFPEYSTANLGSEVARYQQAGSTVDAAENRSGYSFGDPGQRSIAGQLAFMPLGLLTALFRPLLVEAHNPQAAVAGLESTLLIVLTLRVLRRQSWRGALSMIRESPPLMFCAVFVLLFGIAVGITSTNLGTLTRYRTPLMPFFALLILTLDADKRSRRPAPELRVVRRR